MSDNTTSPRPYFLLGLIVGGLLAALLLLVVKITCFSLAGVRADWIVYSLALILVSLALFPILYPIIHYQQHGQKQRIERILGFFSPALIAEYFSQFWSGNPEYRAAAKDFKANRTDAKATKTLEDKFSEQVAKAFGQDRIQSATIFLGMVGFVVLFFAFMGGLQMARGEVAHFPLGLKPGLADLAAIFGAYTWITSDAIYRYRQSDLSSSDVYWYALRLIVAIPLGQAIAAYAPMTTPEGKAISTTGPLLAFVVSMFSFTSIQQILSSFTNRAFNIQTVVSEARDDVTIKLPGIDQKVADRLAAEGVTTVAHLAGVDPINLSSRAGLSFQIILLYVDAAILWQFVGIKLLKLREFGWIGASHIIDFAERQGRAQQSLFDACFQAEQDLVGSASEFAAALQKLKDTEALVTVATLPTDSPALAVEMAKAEVNAKAAALQETAEKRDNTQLAVLAWQPADPLIFNEMATAAEMKETALRELVKEILSDPYAQFVHRVINATSS